MRGGEISPPLSVNDTNNILLFLYSYNNQNQNHMPNNVVPKQIEMPHFDLLEHKLLGRHGIHKNSFLKVLL